MFKVECEGCHAPYQVDERRVPPAGLKMRCPKCGTTFVVHQPAGVGGSALATTPVEREAPPRATLRESSAPPNEGSTSALPPLPAPPEPGRNKRTMLGVGLDALGGSGGGLPPIAAPPRPNVSKTRSTAGSFTPELDDVDLDLPQVAGPSSKPPKGAPSFDLDELPSPVQGGAKSSLPGGIPKPPAFILNQAGVTDDLDLPLPAADLPAPAADLPALGGVDLPAVGGGGLPAVAPPPLPTAATSPSTAPTALPTPASSLPTVQPGSLSLPTPSSGGDDFGEIDLSLVSPQSSAPPVGAPSSFGPPPIPPAPAAPPDPFDLASVAPPPPPPISGAPASSEPSVAGWGGADGGSVSGWGTNGGSVAGWGGDGSVLTETSVIATEGSVVTRQAGGGTAFGEVDLLGGVGTDVSVSTLFPTEDLKAPSSPPAPENLGAAPPFAAPVVPSALDNKPGAPVLLLPKRTSRRVQIVGAVVSLLLVGAGALELTSLGAFGRHAVMAVLNKEKYALLLSGTMASSRQAFANDTFADAKSMLAAIDKAHAENPRAPGLLAYGAFAGYMTELRFGRDSAIDAHAKHMLADVPFDETGRPIELAHPAQAAVQGQLPRARQLVEAVLHRDPNDIDALVLAGEIELLAKDDAKAVEAWKRAVEADQGTARTTFGLARALYAAGNVDEAAAQAEAALKHSPRHVGARILLARIAWAKSDEATAVRHLTEVISDESVSAGASNSERVDALTLLGHLHIARSRVTDAGKVLIEALKLDPKSGPALAGMGEVLFREGRYTDALARFEAGIQADPDGIASKIGVAKTRIALERLQDAKDMLRKLREAHPNDVQVAFWMGRAEELLGDKAAAEALYAEAIRLGGTRPEVVEPYIALSQLMAAEGRTAEAEAKLAEARRQLPGSSAIHKALGDMYLAAGRYEAARGELEAARQIDPDDLSALFKLGVTLRHMKRYDESAAMFDAVAAADKEYPGLALERGLLYEASNRTHEALEYYQQALAKAPDDPDLMLRVGSTEVAAGHAEQAVEILRKVLQKRPNSAEANHFLGRALLLKGANLAEALRYLTRATEIDPNRAEYHLYRGWAANEAGQPAVARDSLLRALALDKQLADAHWQFGVMLRKQGAVVDAIRHLQKALELRPTRYEAYAALAECYEERADWAEAEAAWRKAIQGDPNRAYWRYRLGKMLGPQRGLNELELAVQLEEQKAQREPWLSAAYFELAEAEFAAGKRGAAKDHYIQFLNLGRQDSPYRADALKRLSAMGVRYEQM